MASGNPNPVCASQDAQERPHERLGNTHQPADGGLLLGQVMDIAIWSGTTSRATTTMNRTSRSLKCIHENA